MIRLGHSDGIQGMLSKPRIPIAGAALAAALGLAAAAASSSLAARAATTHVIKAQHILFTPERLSIHRGERVTWKFLDANVRTSHTVTSVGSKRFKDLPDGKLSGSFTVRFNQPGRYRFICTFHPGSMNGVIIVR